MFNHYYLKAKKKNIRAKLEHMYLHTYFIVTNICPTLGKLGAFEFLEATDRMIACFYDLLKIRLLKSLFKPFYNGAIIVYLLL